MTYRLACLALCDQQAVICSGEGQDCSTNTGNQLGVGGFTAGTFERDAVCGQELVLQRQQMQTAGKNGRELSWALADTTVAGKSRQL